VRILFVNNLQGYYGGVEQIVADYSRGLTRRGHECYLAYGKDGRDPEDYEKFFAGTYACAQLGCCDQGYSFSEIVESSPPMLYSCTRLSNCPPDWWRTAHPFIRY